MCGRVVVYLLLDKVPLAREKLIEFGGGRSACKSLKWHF
jgi:hypothetical protein